MNKEKYWLRFILSGKAEDYVKYSKAKSAEKVVEDYSYIDRRPCDKIEQYRG